MRSAGDEDFLTGLGITPEPFDLVPAPVIRPRHSELLDWFDDMTKPLTQASVAGILTLSAHANAPMYTSFPFPRDGVSIFLEYGTEWRVGERFLFSSVSSERRTFGIGLAAAHIGLFDDEYIQWIFRGTDSAEFRIRNTERAKIYGRVLTFDEWQSRNVGPYVEALETARPGDMIDAEHIRGGTTTFEVVRVSTRGTLYVRRPGMKSIRTITERDIGSWLRSVRVVSTAGRAAIATTA